MQKILFLLMCICLTTNIPSQEYSDVRDLVVLETVVVTGTKTERALSDVPVRTEVISKDFISKHHSKNLKDALENLPGLYFSSSHGKQGAVVSMQGFDENRVLILIDGNRIVSNTGSAVDLSQIPVTNVERIEIVKGATSALHGSDAMGGVINVITNQSNDTLSFSLGSDIGSYLNHSMGNHIDTEHIFESFLIQNKFVKLNLATDYRNDEGFDFDQQSIDTNGDEIEQFNFFSKLTFSPNSNIDFGFDFNYFEEDKKRIFSSFLPGLGIVKNYYLENLFKFQYGSDFKYLFDSGSLFKSKLYYEDFADKTIEDIASSQQIDKGRNANVDLLGGDFQIDWIVDDSLLFTFGASPVFERMSQSQFSNGQVQASKIVEIKPGSSRSNYAFYSQVDWNINDWFEVLPGLRYQNDSDFGDFIAPKLNFSFKAKSNILIRFGYGVGYRVPNLKERYYFFDHSSLGYQVVGNPGLMPEESQSFQFGFDYRHKKRFHLDVNWFYNRVKNLIDTQIDLNSSDNIGVQIYTYQNISRATTYGTEIQIDGNITENIKANAGYAYLNAKDDVANKWLPRRSNNQIKAGLSFSLEKFKSELLLNWSYYSDQYVDAENFEKSPGWSVLDIKINQRISKSFNLFFGLKNAFDIHRESGPNQSSDFRPSSGRYFYLGFKYNFNFKRRNDEKEN